MFPCDDLANEEKIISQAVIAAIGVGLLSAIPA